MIVARINGVRTGDSTNTPQVPFLSRDNCLHTKVHMLRDDKKTLAASVNESLKNLVTVFATTYYYRSFKYLIYSWKEP